MPLRRRWIVAALIVVTGAARAAALTVDELLCGNGVVPAGDDGNTLAGDGCSATCTVDATCGDGAVAASEQCDDAITPAGTLCNPWQPQLCRKSTSSEFRYGDPALSANGVSR